MEVNSNPKFFLTGDWTVSRPTSFVACGISHRRHHCCVYCVISSQLVFGDLASSCRVWATTGSESATMGPEAVIDKAMGGRFQSHRVN